MKKLISFSNHHELSLFLKHCSSSCTHIWLWKRSLLTRRENWRVAAVSWKVALCAACHVVETHVLGGGWAIFFRCCLLVTNQCGRRSEWGCWGNVLAITRAFVVCMLHLACLQINVALLQVFSFFIYLHLRMLNECCSPCLPFFFPFKYCFSFWCMKGAMQGCHCLSLNIHVGRARCIGKYNVWSGVSFIGLLLGPSPRLKGRTGVKIL